MTWKILCWIVVLLKAWVNEMETICLKTYVNEHNNDQRALVEWYKFTANVILTGDQYHDKIIERIEGFLLGLHFSDTVEVDYEEIVISSENKLFEFCEFEVE